MDQCRISSCGGRGVEKPKQYPYTPLVSLIGWWVCTMMHNNRYLCYLLMSHWRMWGRVTMTFDENSKKVPTTCCGHEKRVSGLLTRLVTTNHERRGEKSKREKTQQPTVTNPTRSYQFSGYHTNKINVVFTPTSRSLSLSPSSFEHLPCHLGLEEYWCNKAVAARLLGWFDRRRPWDWRPCRRLV